MHPMIEKIYDEVRKVYEDYEHMFRSKEAAVELERKADGCYLTISLPFSKTYSAMFVYSGDCEIITEVAERIIQELKYPVTIKD